MQPGGAPYIPQQPASQVPVGYVAQQPVVMQPPPGVYAGAVAPPADGQPHVIGYDEFGRPIYAAQTKAVMMRSTVNGVVQRSWVGNLCGCCGDINTCCWTIWCPCCVFGENYRRAFNMNRTFLATLFFFCLMVAPHVPQFVIAGACGSKFTAVGSIPLAAQLQAAAAAAAAGNSTNSTSGPSPAYGTCSSVFPNITGVAMPSVGNNNTQLQNMAQVSCVGSGTTYWVAGINNQCNAPACFTSAGVACTAGTAGCPCTIVTACTPQVATAPVPCLLCPPTPCVVCPPVPPPPPPSPPPPPVAIISSDANYTNAVTAAAAIANGTSVLVGRRLSIFGGGASGGGGSRGGGGGGGYVAPSNNNYHNNNNNGGGGAPAGPAPPSMECVSADCQSCSQHISSVIGPIVGFVMLAFIIFAGYMRNRLHKAYNIQKDQFCCVEDSWLPWLVCYPLALCQEARTIDVMERDQELVEGIQDPQAAPLMKQL